MDLDSPNVPLGIGILSLVLIIISKIIEITFDEKVHLIAWAASALIVLSFTIIRYRVIDMDTFSRKIKGTNLFGEIDLKPERFIEWMHYAMIIGFIATITIYINFIAGMIIYLIMQIALIIAFSGIFTLNPLKYIKYGTSRMRNIVALSIVFWLSAIVWVYMTYVYSGADSLIVVPYVIALGLMAQFTWYGLGYSRRSAVFRWMIVLAAMIFVFSDALIGNHRFGGQTGPDWLYLLIDVTYVLNIFLMSHSVLFFDID